MIAGAKPCLDIEVRVENWELAAPLRITGYIFSDVDILFVRLSDGAHDGRGEAYGVLLFDDMPRNAVPQIEAVRARIEAGITREELRQLLPPGCARNAIDCALWELQSKQQGRTVAELAGLPPTKPMITTYTLGADTPEAMAAGANRGKFAGAKALKLKLLGDGNDADRVRAVREARDDVWIGVDANQGFTPDSLAEVMPALLQSRVELIEQPFKVGQEALLDDFVCPIPVVADESAQSLEDLEGLAGRFQVVSVKLDKCGGLTEGLMMARRAKELGLKVIVGNMTGTSLGMAPAMLVGQYCEMVDLDGPLFLKSDRDRAVVYDNGLVSAPPGVWGWSAD